jgi:hypothetical protein
MPELNQVRLKVVNAILGRRPDYIRVVDWEGQSLTFILVDEIRPDEKPGLRATEEEQPSPS